MKTKPILPSLREKKRYLAFEVVSKAPIKEFPKVREAIYSSLASFLGTLNLAGAGVMVLENTWNKKKQRGLIKVNHKHVDQVKVALMQVNKISRQPVVIRSLGVSGIIKKAHNRYVAA